MKKILIGCALMIALVVIPTSTTNAVVWSVVQEAIKTAIRALDLQVQRLQNKTIWLQNAQKNVENLMSKMQLDNITSWVEKQREQYANYFDELDKVKLAISSYKQISEVVGTQKAIFREYKTTFGQLRKDKHFTESEVKYMLHVYQGILNESIKNLDLLVMVTETLSTRMTDGKRLALISEASKSMDENLNDLRLFNRQNMILSLQRSKDGKEIAQVKSLYGLK